MSKSSSGEVHNKLSLVVVVEQPCVCGARTRQPSRHPRIDRLSCSDVRVNGRAPLVSSSMSLQAHCQTSDSLSLER